MEDITPLGEVPIHPVAVPPTELELRVAGGRLEIVEPRVRGASELEKSDWTSAIHQVRTLVSGKKLAVLAGSDLTQEELAQLVGASRETVNKALADFASRGWVQLLPRAVVVTDYERLSRRGK